MNIPPKIRLKPIDLSKCTMKKGGAGGYQDHPDISTKKSYLVKVGGNYKVGTFSMQWYGLNFDGFYDAGLQFDMPGTNSSMWEGVWEIVEVKPPAHPKKPRKVKPDLQTEGWIKVIRKKKTSLQPINDTFFGSLRRYDAPRRTE